MPDSKKVRLLLLASLVVLTLTISVVYVGSALAGKKGVGQETEVFALSIGDGPAQVGYVDANGDVDAWGPSSFAVLSNGNVAILDTANRRVLVVGRTGKRVQSLPYADLGLVSPGDICEWHGRLAVTESGTEPESIVLVDMNLGKSEKRIALPEGLAQSGARFATGGDGDLRLALGMCQTHRVTDGATVRIPSDIEKGEAGSVVPGVGEVVVEDASPAEQVGPGIRVTGANGRSQSSRRVCADSVPAQRIEVLGNSQAGGLLLSTGYLVPSADRVIPKGYVEELQKDTLDTIAAVTIPEDEFYLWPTRYLAVDNKGQVWCMVAAADRVSFRILTPMLGKPDVGDGSIARSMVSLVKRAGKGVSGVLGPPVAMADTAGAHTSPWTRSQGVDALRGYSSINWYCGLEAYDRDCGTASSGPYNNKRPVWMTVYNHTYSGFPYAWGKWDKVSSFKTYVNSAGRDAGDASGGTYSDGRPYPTLSCVMGTDCSGLVSRVWGLSTKHGTSNLGAHAIKLPDTTPLSSLIFLDAMMHPGHVMLFASALDSDRFYCYEATTQGYDRVRKHLRSWYELSRYSDPYHKYRYKYWTN